MGGGASSIESGPKLSGSLPTPCIEPTSVDRILGCTRVMELEIMVPLIFMYP